jgi:hypothetical protein
MARAMGRDTVTRVDSPSNVRDVVERSKLRGSGGPEPDEIYGIVSVLYHALQGASAYDQYIGDAQAAGDAELERFFRACRTEEHARARRAKGLLVSRLADQPRDVGTIDDTDDEADSALDEKLGDG